MMQVIRVYDDDGGAGRVSRQTLHCVCANKCADAWSMSAYASVPGCKQHVSSFSVFFACVCVCARSHLKVNVVGAVGGLGTANVWFHGP